MKETEPKGNPEQLLQIVGTTMAFGRFRGRTIDQLPVSYLEWFATKGFPEGHLGELLATMYEIKINGLEYLLKPLKK